MSALRAKELICEYGRAIPGAGHAWRPDEEESREVQIGNELLGVAEYIGAAATPEDLRKGVSRLEELGNELIQMHSS